MRRLRTFALVHSSAEHPLCVKNSPQGHKPSSTQQTGRKRPAARITGTGEGNILLAGEELLCVAVTAHAPCRHPWASRPCSAPSRPGCAGRHTGTRCTRASAMCCAGCRPQGPAWLRASSSPVAQPPCGLWGRPRHHRSRVNTAAARIAAEASRAGRAAAGAPAVAAACARRRRLRLRPSAASPRRAHRTLWCNR